MTPGKLKLVAEFYVKRLEFAGVKLNRTNAPLERAAYCAKHIASLVDEGKIEKAMRWLGFVQGVLFAMKVFTVEDLMDHSREISPQPELNESKMIINQITTEDQKNTSCKVPKSMLYYIRRILRLT